MPPPQPFSHFKFSNEAKPGASSNDVPHHPPKNKILLISQESLSAIWASPSKSKLYGTLLQNERNFIYGYTILFHEPFVFTFIVRIIWLHLLYVLSTVGGMQILIYLCYITHNFTCAVCFYSNLVLFFWCLILKILYM